MLLTLDVYEKGTSFHKKIFEIAQAENLKFSNLLENGWDTVRGNLQN